MVYYLSFSMEVFCNGKEWFDRYIDFLSCLCLLCCAGLRDCGAGLREFCAGLATQIRKVAEICISGVPECGSWEQLLFHLAQLLVAWGIFRPSVSPHGPHMDPKVSVGSH